MNHCLMPLKNKCLLLLVLLTGITIVSTAQTDKWTGIWRTAVKPWGVGTPITMELHIGAPEAGMLYPATIKIQYGSFTGRYELLLAKKNEQQLGIGRNKYPLEQTPFKLGIWMWYLNGTFDYQNGVLSLHRMWIDKFDIWMRGLDDDDEIYEQTKVALRDFLYRGAATFTKSGNKPFADSSVRRILHSEEDSNRIYFGIYDPVLSKDSMAALQIIDQEQYDKDTVTLLHNGRVLFTREQINDHNRRLNVKLDTGNNNFIFFADNYGSLPPNTGLLQATIDNKEYKFNFSNRSNAYATFLVANIYHPGSGQDTIVHDSSSLTRKVIQRENVPVATIPVNTADIILELRDTKVQDGDSISLSLNGQWITTGFPVKTAMQEIRIHLQPGANILLFTADNLGAIPPNTAELRIRYGRKSKTFNLSTDMRKNNEIKLILE